MINVSKLVWLKTRNFFGRGGGVAVRIQFKDFSSDFMYERTNSEEVWLNVVQGSADTAGFASRFVLCRLSFGDIYRSKAIRVPRRLLNDAT